MRQAHGMRVRIATRDDVEALAELRSDFRIEEGTPPDAEPDFLDRFSSFFAEALAGGRWTVWVAETDAGTLVSNVWVYRIPKVPSPGAPARDFGYVTNVYTRPSERSRGVGGRVLTAVSRWARELDLEMLIVWPSEASVPFYRRAGFEPTVEMLELEIAGYEG